VGGGGLLCAISGGLGPMLKITCYKAFVGLAFCWTDPAKFGQTDMKSDHCAASPRIDLTKSCRYYALCCYTNKVEETSVGVYLVVLILCQRS
jgi:hypothetical protein